MKLNLNTKDKEKNVKGNEKERLGVCPKFLGRPKDVGQHKKKGESEGGLGGQTVLRLIR